MFFGGRMSQNSTCVISSADPAQQIADSIIGTPAVLFSGQGSQVGGMGRELAESSKDAMDYWILAEKISGLPLREIYWSGNDEDMSDTRALQPALTVTNLNHWRELEKRAGITPAACAGHSLGEFAALGCAGVLSPRDVLEVTSLRGRLMAEADPAGTGTMGAIVKLDEEAVNRIVEEAARETGDIIVAANYNTPLQTVVSGSRKAVDLALEKARALKGRGMELKVSGAFHSPMMAEANKELQPLLEKVEWHDPRFPVYANVDGKPLANGDAAKKSIWRQMISPVYWINLVHNLYLAGIRWWMELSPRAVLGKMLGPSMAGIASYCDDLRIDLVNSLSSIVNYTL